MSDDDMDTEPLNEWVVSELSRVRDALADLTRRHEEVLNHLADVCRRNDKMQAVGNAMRDMLELWYSEGDSDPAEVDKLIQKWSEANV